MNESEYAIDVAGLTKQFDDKVVVNNISLQVKKGAIFGFLGSNGSGKTTTIRMLCGLLTPTSGTGSCLGYDILTNADQIKLHTGYMPQKFSFYERLTAYENLQFIADVYQLDNKASAIKGIIQDLELEPYQKLKASMLSGGWKQRLSLACCLLHKPQLLFLDEPTAGVDPKARKDFWDYLHLISTRDETTVLVTTHYMDEAEKCTDLAYINVGNLLYSGATGDLRSYSKVIAYVFDGDKKLQTELENIVHQKYPDLLVSIVNNELRISSRDQDKLKKFMSTETQFKFIETTPSFEEVFIGLMK